MRRGRVFRRCTSCRRAVKGRRCTCGHGRITWTFVVDLEPPGSGQRRQVTRGGFETEADATAAMNRLQSDRAEGLWVELSTITAGAYLRQWVKGLEAAPQADRAEGDEDAAEDIRDNTLTGYEVYVRRHLGPRLDDVRLQQLTRARVRATYRDIRATPTTRGTLPKPKTIWNIHLCLHRALQDAIKAG